MIYWGGWDLRALNPFDSWGTGLKVCIFGCELAAERLKASRWGNGIRWNQCLFGFLSFDALINLKIRFE